MGKGNWRRAKSFLTSTKEDYFHKVAETLVEAIKNGMAPWVQA
ncbi:MAG: hypothetical protein OXN89_01945 [Bryobacterales bacterium]|nr:hypothetical protein [Bryobacterales bacterium]